MPEQRILIEGGLPLRGTVPISGAKNSALPCLFATLLTEENSRLRNLPDVQDTKTALKILESLGHATSKSDQELEIDPSADFSLIEVPMDLARSMRASILTLGPLLATRGNAIVPLPGGCDFGSRPIDIHLRGLEKLGAKVEMQGGVLRASATNLEGAHLVLDYPTFTGTENLMMAATLAKGTTVIENAGREPEIADLAVMLNGMGANISGAGEATIVIEGVAGLHGAQHSIMPDRIEAGTYLAAVVAASGEIRIEDFDPALLAIVLEKLQEAGASIETSPSSITLGMDGRPSSFDIVTLPYPGFPTDLQAQMMAVNAIATGTSRIEDQVWKQRFRTADELALLGANITVQGNCAMVTGVSQLVGGHVQASDLRASAALVIAGLCATGTTEIHGLCHLTRGYEDLPRKLRNLGAKVELVS